jgi:hypothetical protein
MASTAATWGWRVGPGAGLMVASDALIGIGLTETADVPGRPAFVMATYLLGLALVVGGWPARSVPLPAQVARPAPADHVTA